MVAERFPRPPGIATELAALPDEDDPEYLDQLRAASLEVIIIARRGAADAALRRRIESITAELALPVIHATAVTWGKAPWWEGDDVKGLAAVMFWEEIREESYFEVNFLSAAITIARRAGDRIRGGKQRAREREATGRDPVDFAESRTHDPYQAIDDRMIVRRALDTLSEDQARAITLHYLMELPIFSENPARLTVASEFGFSERKARGFMADARAALRRWFETEGRDD